MTDLMTASKAREIVEQMEDERASKLKAMAKEAIEKAVQAGQRKASLEVQFTDHERMEKWLKSIGYAVNAGDCQRDGTWFYVEW